MKNEWRTFQNGVWEKEINVRDFIQKNYTPYDGDESFLAGPTQNTKDLWDQVMDLSQKEREAGGVLDMDTRVISTITSHGPGYLEKSKETIVGFQTDKPFKRALQPYGGIRMAERHALITDIKWIRKFPNFFRFTERPIMPAYLTPIPRKCAHAVPAISLQAFRMLTDADALSATTEELLSMVWTA